LTAVKRTRISEIDLLRFFAALAVVFFHYSFRGFSADGLSKVSYPLLAPISKYGYLGVEMFFMISGFVIFMSADTGSLRTFVVSRVVRLYPAFWICCSLTFAIAVMLGGGRDYPSANQYLVNMTMLSGFVGVPPIDGVYWSLFVELKFYALVALVLISGMIHKAELLLLMWLTATISIETLDLGTLRYFAISDFSAFFIAGAALFRVWSRGLSPTRIGLTLAAWIMAICQSLQQVPELERHYRTTFNIYVISAVISAFFLVMILVSLRTTGRFGKANWLVFGALSYPLYLIHQNIGFMILNLINDRLNKYILLFGAIAFMLCFAYGIHRLFERKLSASLKVGINYALDFCARRQLRDLTSR